MKEPELPNGRPRRFDLPREHPAIDMTRMTPMVLYRNSTMAAPVTCPDCGAERWYPLSTLRQQLELKGFVGRCRPCGFKFSRIQTAITKRAKGGRRWVTKVGYAALSRFAVAPEDEWMFDAMRGVGSFVFEHRWNMAKHLGRPLRTNECVDHMDGAKANNVIANLRLYVRGKDQAGSAYGYGTYYHEWQMAEAKLRALGAA